MKMPVVIAVSMLVVMVALLGFRGLVDSTIGGPSVIASVIQTNADDAPSALGFVVNDIAGNPVDLSSYRGKVVMIVNVASKCGFTKQYEQLQSLHEKYQEKGLVVLGFPANNFGGQEPGSNEEIAAFCSSKFGVTFPMMSKVSVKGDDQHELFRFLTSAETGGAFAGDIGWNFTKFVIGRSGQVIGRFPSRVSPEDAEVIKLIEEALAVEER